MLYLRVKQKVIFFTFLFALLTKDLNMMVSVFFEVQRLFVVLSVIVYWLDFDFKVHFRIDFRVRLFSEKRPSNEKKLILPVQSSYVGSPVCGVLEEQSVTEAFKRGFRVALFDSL